MKRSLYIVLLMGLFAGCAMLPGGDDGDSATGSGSSQSQGATADDSAITSAVQANLSRDELVGNSNVNVTSNQGIVTLSGQLPTARAANRAFSVARSTEGVRRVISNLSWPSP